MDFDDSLFEDFESKKKEQKKQSPYKVMTRDKGWFLLPNIDRRSDQTQPSFTLKYKADYFYGQGEYEKALGCFKQVLQLVPSTNVMLWHEVKESIVLCLTKMNKPIEAMKTIKELIKSNKSDASLWLLLSSLCRENNDIQGAILALQHCLKDNEEIANFWIELANCYSILSRCINLADHPFSCLSDNKNKNQGFSSIDDISILQEHRLQEPNIDNEDLSNIDDAQRIDGKVVGKISEMTVDNERTIHDIHVGDHLEIFCNGIEDIDLCQYIDSHRSCYCTLCSLLIARFLHHKYSFHLSPLQSQKRKKDIYKVDEMISGIKCATLTIVEATKNVISCRSIGTK